MVQMVACLSLLYGGVVWGADTIKVGVILAVTGPGASLGIPMKNTIPLLPKEIGGKKVEYIFLDDASDVTTAVKDTHKLLSEEKVDVLMGSCLTPNVLPMIDPVAAAETPLIAFGASIRVVDPMDAKRAWVFKVPPNDTLMASAVVEHMAAHKVKTVGQININDSYGQSWRDEAFKLMAKHNIKVVANESYAAQDNSVTAQILKIVAAKPDAVLISSRGTPAVLPAKALKERGYKGIIYQTHGVANNDFLRLGGKDLNGEIVPVGPVLVGKQLPDSNPVKKQALAYIKAYEAAYGPDSTTTFGAHVWDAGIILQKAIPQALKVAQPGTKEFRKALRDSIEKTSNLPVSAGVFTFTKTDHAGLDNRACVLVEVQNGKWKLLK
jgi:branched-chain amino acid transport system substrate-binding protein